MTTALVITAGGCIAGLSLLWARLQLLVVSVTGPSMEPTLRNGQRVMARRRHTRRFQAGQLVVVRQPPPWRTLESWDGGRLVGPEGFYRRGSHPPADRWMIKRIVAVGGEPVPDVLAGLAVHLGSVVPPGHLLLLGDNPAASYDSRRFGYLPADWVLGVVTRRR